MACLLVIVVIVIMMIYSLVNHESRREKELLEKIHKVSEETAKRHQRNQKSVDEAVYNANIFWAKEKLKEGFIPAANYDRAIKAYARLETEIIKISSRKDRSFEQGQRVFLLKEIQFEILFTVNGVSGADECAERIRKMYGASWYKECWVYYDKYIDERKLIEVAMAYELVFGEASDEDIYRICR